MRNLQLLSSDVTETSIEGLSCFLIVDVLSQTIFFATSKELFSFSLQSKTITNRTCINNGNIISIEHLVDDDLLSIATSNGDIYEWRFTDGALECIATMDSGTKCMSWSPDQDIVVLSTGDGKLLLMNRDFDPLFETELNPMEFGEAQLITVGWGKKETQFHGKEGKPTAEDLKQKVAEPVLPWDDKRVRIRWSEDGQHFAVSSVDSQTGSRKVRVRSREGALFSTNEVIKGLEHSLDWKPSGNLIASSQRKPNKHDIIFLEKNGLMHGEFSLPFKTKEVQVVELCWNRTSEVLAVWLEELKDDNDLSNGTSLSYVQLWTRNNYHWYLKQELRFSNTGLKISSILWDPEIPLKLHVICVNGFYHQFTWHWTVSRSKDSCVAVIDGVNLMLTPFSKAVVPPPMSLQNVVLQAPVNQVCFANSSSHANVVLSDGTVQSLQISENKILAETVEITFENVEDDAKNLFNQFGLLHLVHWIDNIYLAVARNMKKQRDNVFLLISPLDNLAKMHVRDMIPLNKKVHSIAINPDTLCVAIQMQNGEICTCERDDSSISVKPWVTCLGSVLLFPNRCETISVCTVNHTDVLIGMTDRYQLYIDEKQIAENCTSFAIHDEYLVYTTHAHSLRCLLLDNLLKFLLGDESVDLIAERSIERGSRIVSVVSQDTRVILQMPRGNLETIHPRVLVVSFLKKLLDKMAYKKALVMMKRHRINLNLIHDHNPTLFLDNVDAFIKDVPSENDISLFLADLIEDDVTCSLYASCYAKRSSEEKKSDTLGGKVDRICSAIREAIQRIGTDRLFLSFLTSYVRQTVPDLEEVLFQIKKVKDNVIQTSVTFDKSLKHILYMTDVEELYNVALGLYDFDIILMIAEKSNKDPKEYLPFLNELKKYQQNYCKFKIDCYLKRYKKALLHIFNCGHSHFEEFLEFVVSNGLYKDALELCRNNPESIKSVSFLYGAELAKKKAYEEAGLVYSSVGFCDEALECFVSCLHWKLALCEAAKLRYSKDKMNQFAKSLAGQLRENKRWNEAAFLLEIYLEDFESAIMAYIDGNLWEDSLRLIYGCGRQDLIETNLIPAILDAHRHYSNTIDDLKERYLRYKERLSVVRLLKERQSSELTDGCKDEPENDLFSDTSSITGLSSVSASSKGSRMTGHSSKSRRKSQRKKYSLKEGSKYEDFALMEALAQIINSVDKLQESIPSILRILVMFSRQSEAFNLQNSFSECLLLMRSKMNEIWMIKPDENTQNISTGPEATVTSIVAEFLSKKQPLADSNIPDLPQLTQPNLRNDVRWKLSLLS